MIRYQTDPSYRNFVDQTKRSILTVGSKALEQLTEIVGQLTTSTPIDQGVPSQQQLNIDISLPPIPVSLAGGKKGLVGVHIVIPGTVPGIPEGNVHIQPIPGSHHKGEVIDPAAPLQGQIKQIVKGKNDIKKVEEAVKKALEKLDELRKSQPKETGNGTDNKKQ